MPSVEIDRLAAEVIAKYGHEAEAYTAAKEQGAWYDCDSAEQGKWRRVRQRMSAMRET